MAGSMSSSDADRVGKWPVALGLHFKALCSVFRSTLAPLGLSEKFFALWA